MFFCCCPCLKKYAGEFICMNDALFCSNDGKHGTLYTSLHTNLMEDLPKLCFFLPRGAQTQVSQMKFLGGGNPAKWNGKIGEIRGRLHSFFRFKQMCQGLNSHYST